jgi:hypothetical protein
VQSRRTLQRLRRARRRLSSACFFVAGVGFGSAVYLLRARFATLSQPGRFASFLLLVALMIALFWLGARADAEVDDLDEQLRELDRNEASRSESARKPPGRSPPR